MTLMVDQKVGSSMIGAAVGLLKEGQNCVDNVANDFSSRRYVRGTAKIAVGIGIVGSLVYVIVHAQR